MYFKSNLYILKSILPTITIKNKSHIHIAKRYEYSEFIVSQYGKMDSELSV
jgi:hypothetical protein